jgi:hypothetical protein
MGIRRLEGMGKYWSGDVSCMLDGGRMDSHPETRRQLEGKNVHKGNTDPEIRTIISNKNKDILYTQKLDQACT